MITEQIHQAVEATQTAADAPAQIILLDDATLMQVGGGNLVVDY